MVTMVRAAALTHFSDVMRELGGDPDKALRQAGLRPALLREQDQLIDVAIVARLLEDAAQSTGDRKSTRLNSSHTVISYAVFCLQKKKNNVTAIDLIMLTA